MRGAKVVNRKWSAWLMICPLILVLSVMASAQMHTDDFFYSDFDVYLDDKKVGKHQFQVSDMDGAKLVQSDASFNYKILFFTAYRYEHSAAECWADNCLVKFDATTNSNGDRISVSGEQTGDGFVEDSGDSPIVLPACVMTFAYWNAEFINQSRLLNPQTGEYLDVRVEKVGDEIREILGQQIVATLFRLTALEVDLTFWYSSTNEWLGLESVVKGGRIIRYELS